MLINFRHIDGKFWLSGGWYDVPEDTKWLSHVGFRAVLDLQHLPGTDPVSIATVAMYCTNNEILYHAIEMEDGENKALDKLYENAYDVLTSWDTMLDGFSDKILIKCGVGVSRSVSVYIYYLCMSRNWNFTQAYNFVRDREMFNGNRSTVALDIVLRTFLENKFGIEKKSAFGEVV